MTSYTMTKVKNMTSYTMTKVKNMTSYTMTKVRYDIHCTNVHLI